MPHPGRLEMVALAALLSASDLAAPAATEGTGIGPGYGPGYHRMGQGAQLTPELQALYAQPTPDQAKVKALSDEVLGLRAVLAKKRNELQTKYPNAFGPGMCRGFHRGFGGGMGGGWR